MENDVQDIKDLKVDENAISSGRKSNLIVGSVVILIGLAMLLGGGRMLANWWALVFLIPLGFLGTELYSDFQSGRELDSGKMVGFLSIGLVASIFLFGLSWGTMWPAFIVLAGIGILLGKSKF